MNQRQFEKDALFHTPHKLIRSIYDEIAVHFQIVSYGIYNTLFLIYSYTVAETRS